MKYVALLSGGKDSCYNLLHCKKNGHELVAAASLGPEPGKEELDSYLYQTVGQDAIEFVARALDVPLYRRIITGNAVEQGSEYGDRNANDAGGVKGDETEDLYSLLADVQLHHPDVQGVSVGAILSNYQRVRVEHVCRRLGLISLAYLWRRDQRELLSEMVEAGMEAILIKVAGIGLATTHLGKTIQEMQPTLNKLNDLYGSHICGEGGEYETLTLDCPLFKQRIVLTETETVIHSDSDFATVAFLRVHNAVLEPKTTRGLDEIVTPPLLDHDFALVTNVNDSHATQQRMQYTGMAPSVDVNPSQTGSTRKIGSWVSVTNIQRNSSPLKELSVEEEVSECFNLLSKSLAGFGMRLSNVVNINVFLSSIELFACVNAVYSTFFGISPPARACVAVDLPRSIQVRLDCIAYNDYVITERQALHVQGLSYWAPANIGPYSQAITIDERVFISGQIGLLPNQLTLPFPPSLGLETALASQHVSRITGALQANSGGSWGGQTQGIIYWLAEKNNLHSIKAWHITLKETKIPTLFLTVKSLPKDAQIEKQVLLHTGRCMIIDESDGEALMEQRPRIFKEDTSTLSDGATLHWQISKYAETTSAYAVLCIKLGANGVIPALRDTANNILPLSRILSARLFYNPAKAASLHLMSEALFGQELNAPVTLIPCRDISTATIDDWEFAFGLFIV